MTTISHEEILRNGTYRGMTLAGVAPALAARMYVFMVRLRRLQQAIMAAYHPADQMRCPIHFCVGQEAVPAALSLLIEADDFLFTHHRSHGYYLAKGGGMNQLLAELYGRSTGANGGLAGSQEISAPRCRFYSGAILTGATGIATGTGLGIRLKNQSAVSVTVFGDAATDEGLFWEAVSYAVTAKLPVVFICENNRYATYSHQLRRQVSDNIHGRAAGFEIETRAVFGNDVVNNYRTLSEALTHVRAGRGPFFIEAYTYRLNPHVGPEDDDTIDYRPKAEMRFWQENCPIRLLEEHLRGRNLVDDAKKAEWIAGIDREIADAVAFAKSSPFPVRPDWHRLNYAVATPLADRLLADIEEGKPFDQHQRDAMPAPY